jgi:hypothetical protein
MRQITTKQIVFYYYWYRLSSGKYWYRRLTKNQYKVLQIWKSILRPGYNLLGLLCMVEVDRKEFFVGSRWLAGDCDWIRFVFFCLCGFIVISIYLETAKRDENVESLSRRISWYFNLLYIIFAEEWRCMKKFLYKRNVQEWNKKKYRSCILGCFHGPSKTFSLYVI